MAEDSSSKNKVNVPPLREREREKRQEEIIVAGNTSDKSGNKISGEAKGDSLPSFKI